MGDSLNPLPPPPAPPNSDQKSNMPMLYYGLVVVGTAAIVLAVYNLIVIKRCRRRHVQSSQPPNRVDVTDRVSLESSLSRNLLSSFKYKREAEAEGGRDCRECPVCLSGFEEGEEVRKLPRCKHCFHVVCIDMWLYSHFDCPICRTPVVSFCRTTFPAQNFGNGNGVAVEV